MKNDYKLIILTLFAILIIFPSSFAQEKLKYKIDKIDGLVEKIVITSDGKQYFFEGKEAEELFQIIKKGESHNLSWTVADSENGEDKVMSINSDGKEKVIEIDSEGDINIIIKTDKDFDSKIDDITKKVKVEVEDGNKKVTVTTTENGEEKTEVYEGKEADEYLVNMKSENDDFNISMDKDKDGKKVKKIIIETEKEEKNN
jgi:hypothetical protein